ncbi:ParB family protein (plasmid) [Stanieria cyanosphaera PCC 7437]|uniref:ParB family protein n=1 Tax=Stanieria cyanosphaera (strain ATCC 29371 / PCC 7437) TaxID=111780 RepID=K9Y1A7_STAC7|nr:ParB/RepB/Spo0J family partition protein [Stanieria cyanosphaera]AFZ38181.1 ParB family protein [Stanieria cyanosphaera PCC 7437]
MPSKRKSLDESAREFFQSSVTSPKEAVNSAAEFVKIESIHLPEQQPRRYFDPEKLQSLVQSISSHGILEPLLVRPLGDNQYELVAGERRYRAAQIASLTEVPVVIRQLSETEALQLALIENLQREDLNPVEETEGILQLLALKLAIETTEIISLLYQMQNVTAGKITDNVISNSEIESVNQIFTDLGKMNRESFTANRLPLLRLPEDVLSALRSGRIEYTKAKVIASVKDEELRKQLLEDAITNSLSLSQIKEKIKALKPTKEKEELKTRVDTTYKKLKTSKQLWQDPKKRKKLESLLAQLEQLIESESNLEVNKANLEPIFEAADSEPESNQETEEPGITDDELGALLKVSNLIIRDYRVKGKKPPAALAKKLQEWEVNGDRWVRNKPV